MSNVYNVAVLGTSLTTGAYSRGWVFELSKALQVGKKSHVRTHALGREGATSNWGRDNVDPVIRIRPQVVLIEFINDAYLYHQNTPPENMNLGVSKSNFESMIDDIREGSPGTKIYLMTLVKPTQSTQEDYLPSLPDYDMQLSQIAIDEDVGFIDLRAVWGDPEDFPEEYPPNDGTHVYLSAHLRVTIPNIVATISPLIE